MRIRPRNTPHKPSIRRTPRRHSATRNDGLPQSSTRTQETRTRTPGEIHTNPTRMRLWKHFLFFISQLNKLARHIWAHCETPVCTKGCEECASDRASLNTSRASGELPADTQPHGTMGFPKAQRAPVKHEIGRQAISSPAYRHRGTMGLPKARRGHDTVHGPAPAVSPPAHTPSGAAGRPTLLTPHT